MTFHGRSLPDFPWDSLAAYRERARAHPDGLVDLAVGTPVDATPEVVRRALAGAADWPGYPTTVGTPRLRDAMVDWWERRRGVPGLTHANVLPTVGSKEAVALLPSLLGIGRGDVVLHPRVAYPTYDVGARLAGALPVPVDMTDPGSWRAAVGAAWAEAQACGTGAGEDGGAAGDDGGAAGVAGGAATVPRVALVWVNSPSNPEGTVHPVAELRAIVAAARELGAVVASDECYAELGFGGPYSGTAPAGVADAGGDSAGDLAARVPSLLDPRVTDGSLGGLLALYSLSKQSNLAGYRAAMLAGDADLVAGMTEIRKHAGLMVPGPVQAAMTVALADDEHVTAQRERYRARRTELLDALPAAGLCGGERDVAGLYLWLTLTQERAAQLEARGHDWDCWDLVAALADRGILVAPGAFYGDHGRRHVRIGLNASDARMTAAVERLRAGGPVPDPSA